MAWPVSEYLHIAVLTSPHGVKGEMKAKILSDLPDRLAGLEEVYLFSPNAKQNLGKRKIESVRGAAHDLVKLAGVESREEAEKLKGTYLSLSRAEAMPLAEGQYYITDLIGMRVADHNRGLIGTLKDVLDTPSGDLFVIKREGAKDLLLPIRGGALSEVDFAEGIIQVQLPEGLWEIYE